MNLKGCDTFRKMQMSGHYLKSQSASVPIHEKYICTQQLLVLNLFLLPSTWDFPVCHFLVHWYNSYVAKVTASGRCLDKNRAGRKPRSVERSK